VVDRAPIAELERILLIWWFMLGHISTCSQDRLPGGQYLWPLRCRHLGPPDVGPAGQLDRRRPDRHPRHQRAGLHRPGGESRLPARRQPRTSRARADGAAGHAGAHPPLSRASSRCTLSAASCPEVSITRSAGQPLTAACWARMWCSITRLSRARERSSVSAKLGSRTSSRQSRPSSRGSQERAKPSGVSTSSTPRRSRARRTHEPVPAPPPR